MHTYGARIDYEDLKVILKDEKGREIFFYGQREKKSCPLISAIKASNYYVKGVLDIGVMLLTPKQKKRKLEIFL